MKPLMRHSSFVKQKIAHKNIVLFERKREKSRELLKARKGLVWLFYKNSDLSLTEIGCLFAISRQATQENYKDLENNPALREECVRCIKKYLSNCIKI